jgi:hypothetical protein
VKTFTFLTTLLLTAGVFAFSLLAAEEEIKYPSPDGRFALRINEDLKVDLIKASGQILVDLGKLYVEPDTFEMAQARRTGAV